MSDSMSKTEIEDVLSSIRRLVTEDGRPTQNPHASSAGRLLLTPALRIGPAPAEVARTFGAAEPLLLLAAQRIDPAASVSYRAAAAVEAALRGHREDWEPDGTEVAPSTNRSVEWDTADAAEPVGSRPAGADAVAAEAADPPAFPGTQPAAFAGDSDAVHDIWDDFLAEHRSAPLLAAEQAEAWHPAEHHSAGQPGPASEADSTTTERAVMTALPAVVQTVPQAVPADADADDDRQESSSRTASLPEDLSGIRLEEGLAGPSGSEDPPSIDEVLLRDLIRDVLREELQGELGERITRNVRKLVRAELARALAARDLT
jgi:hypothetical protein